MGVAWVWLSMDSLQCVYVYPCDLSHRTLQFYGDASDCRRLCRWGGCMSRVSAECGMNTAAGTTRANQRPLHRVAHGDRKTRIVKERGEYHVSGICGVDGYQRRCVTCHTNLTDQQSSCTMRHNSRRPTCIYF